MNCCICGNEATKHCGHCGDNFCDFCFGDGVERTCARCYDEIDAADEIGYSMQWDNEDDEEWVDL